MVSRDKLKPSLIAGIMGMLMSAILTIVVTYVGHLQPVTFNENVVDNLIGAVFSGLFSGFLGAYFALRKIK